MRTERADRLKAWLGGKMLDLAEALPEAKRGPIHYLQSIRGFHREHANDPTWDARPPAGSHVEIASVRLIEAYSIENFDYLERAIQRLFPKLPSGGARRDTLAELDQSIRSLNAGSWWNIGTVVRLRQRHGYALPVRELPSLPPAVESIRVQAHSILPSIVLLTYDVRLTEDAAAELNRIQSQPYVPEVAFRSLLRPDSGHSEYPVDWVRQRHVRGWVDGLRAEVERVLGEFAPPGLFRVSAGAPRLPAIEVYLLSEGDTALSDDWQTRSRCWLNSYGIESTFGVYRSENALFQWSRTESQWRGVTGHVLAVSREKYLAQIKNPEAYSGDKQAVLYHVEDELNGLIPIVAIVRLLAHTREVVKAQRERVFRRIYTEPFLGYMRLTLPTRMQLELVAESMLLERLKVEFLRHQDRLSRRMRGWDALKFVPKHASRDGDLHTDAFTWIQDEVETLQEHLGLARQAFGEHFTAQNTRAIYWLSVAVLALTVVQVVTNQDVRGWLWAGLAAGRTALGALAP